MLIRQVHEIEKGTIMRKKFTKGPFPPESQESKRAQLEPSIVTLVNRNFYLVHHKFKIFHRDVL